MAKVRAKQAPAKQVPPAKKLAKQVPPTKTPAAKPVPPAKMPAAKPVRSKHAKAKPTAEQLATKRADLLNEAERAVSADQPAKALEYLTEARAPPNTKKYRLAFQQACQGHGNRYLWQQKWKPAAGFYDAGIAIAKAGDDTRMTAEMLAEGGFSLLQLHQVDDAEAWIRRSLELHDEAKRATLGATAVYYLSSVIFERGQMDQAVALARESVQRSTDAGDQRGATFHAYALARALYEQGHSHEAETVSTKALEGARALRLTAVEGNLINMIANVALDDHRLAEGRAHYETARALFQQANLKNHVAITTSNLGNLAWDEDRLDEALVLYADAIKLHGKSKDTRSIAIGLTARAGVLTELGRFDEAVRDLEQALVVMTTKGHERRVSFVRAAFARLAEARGELVEARAHYAEAEMSLEVAGDTVEIGRMLYAAAGVEAELGDPESAETLIARAAALDPASLSADKTGVGEKRAGMHAVRALRELAIARIEAAKSKRLDGDDSNALRRAATARMQAITTGSSSLMTCSSEVRRVVARLAADLAAGAPVQPAMRYQGTAVGTGWKGELSGELVIAVAHGEMVATGRLAWGDRVATIDLRGPDVGPVRGLRGQLSTVVGAHATWQLRFDVDVADKVLRGRLIEVLADGEDEICAIAWSVAGVA